MSEVSQKQLEANQKNAKLGGVKTEEGQPIVPAKIMTIEEAKKAILGGTVAMGGEPTFAIDELRKNLLPKLVAGEKLTKKELESFNENAGKALMAYGLDTAYPLVAATGEKYRPLAIEFTRQIIKEYNCETPSEKALAQLAVGAYIRVMEYSQALHGSRNVEFLSHEANGYYSMFSKELDRANRQFVTAITTLKQIKSPPIELNVKAKTAFISQNQQINTMNNPVVKQDENIDPK